MKQRGLVQVHTNLGSKDSNIDLKSLLKFIYKKNIFFVLLIDHFENLSPKKYEKILNKSKLIYKKYNKLIIPGIEWRDDKNNHFLFFGLSKLPHKIQLKKLKRIGVIIILAHPTIQQLKNFLNSQVYNDVIDGFEILNTKYHNSKFIDQFFKIKSLVSSKYIKLIGLDSHKLSDLYPLGLTVSIVKSKSYRKTSRDIIEQIRRKRFKYFFLNQEFSLDELKILSKKIFFYIKFSRYIIGLLRKILPISNFKIL